MRLSGVYLAMLTLAFAQITWSVAFQWQAVTGGDNGILGVWPDGWASPRWVFYYLSLAGCAGGILMLRRIIFSPFGYALRAGRDLPLRADAVGIDVRRVQWLAFTLAGTFAGLGGRALRLCQGQRVPQPDGDPALGRCAGDGAAGRACRHLSGPVVGAAVFHTLNTEMVRHTEYWRLLLGVSIILLVLIFPMGIAGAFRRRERAA